VDHLTGRPLAWDIGVWAANPAPATESAQEWLLAAPSMM
jgi:hypothetical protein